MPHALSPRSPFDAIEAELLFTRAALRADPDAQDLLPITDTWLSMLEPARAKDRGRREAVANTDAARAVANARLDRVCTSFADQLLLAVGKDRDATRYRQFFPAAASKFVRQALIKQVAAVQAWLTTNDPVLEAHRADLETWCTAVGHALVKTRATTLVRGEAQLAREELARELTRERDGLHELLAARARERNLPRAWPDLFFLVPPTHRMGTNATDDDPASA